MSDSEGLVPPRASHATQGVGAPGGSWGGLPPGWAESAPVALALVDGDGRLQRVNAAFAALLGQPKEGLEIAALFASDAAGLPPAGTPARRLLRRADASPGQAPGADTPPLSPRLPCDAQLDPLAGPLANPLAGGLRLLTLVDRRAEAAHEAEAGRLASLLDFVQTHARIGTWARDALTREGRWDRHMFAFFALDPARGVPQLGQVAQASVPQDELASVLEASMHRPGHYSHRYRLLTPEGRLRHVNTHWEVNARPDGSPDQARGFVMDETEARRLPGAPRDDTAEQLQLAMELSHVAMYRHDLATGLLFFNAQGLAMLGETPRPEGLTREEFNARLHPDDLVELAATYERTLRSQGPEDLQMRLRHNDGTWRTIFTRRVAQRDGRGNPVAFTGVALDITEQVERTRRADELARHLEEVAAASGIGIWRLRRDGGNAEWNAQMFAMCGLPPGSEPPHFHEWVDTCIHPDDRDRVRSYALQWIHEPGDSRAELAHRLLRPDGSVIHVVERGRVEPAASPFRLSGVMIDVTGREMALAALREATERSALATRAAGIGIWEWTAEQGDSRWDEQMFLLRGLSPGGPCPTLEEMAARVHPDDRDFVLDNIRSARDEDRAASYEFRIVWPDGTVRWLASRSMPLRDERGRTRLRLGVNWDITDARAADEARHERALVLRESRAKSELLSRMSHELRTPMNAVLGFTQLLLAEEGADDAPPDARRVARLEHIRAAGEHLMALIDGVLELSRLDAPGHVAVALVPVPVDALVAQTLPLVEALARRHGVALAATPGALQVRADPTRLKQVLVNLLTNAIKYNRPGGHVRVEAEATEGRVRLRVRDDGLGMDESQQRLAFEPFNRAGAEHSGIEGTGIGLTIVRALVERMGGQVTVRSVPGEGSVFEVWLALAPAAGGAAGARPERRLLYVEDNAVNVMIVSELVRRRGDIEFDSAPDGHSGVASAERDPPGLVLVDMQLPDIDGLEVLARLRANPRTAGLRMVALSANAIPADIRRALDAGFDDYWTKPLDFAVFSAGLDQVFGPAPQPAAPAN